LDEIVDMDAKTKLAAAQAEHLSEEKQEKGKKSGSNKKKNRSNKVAECLNSLFASMTF